MRPGITTSFTFTTFAAALLALLLAAPACQAEPDAQALGQDLGYPVGRPGNFFQMPYRVGSWSAIEQTGVPVRTVARGGPVQALPQAAQAPAISYRFRGVAYTLDEYLERQRVTGLLLLKNGEIVAEHYRYGRTPQARFLSFSMAKSITSLLVGIALEKGLIADLDDPAEKYVKALAGSLYGGTRIRHLLRMSSGVQFTENYDGQDDVAKLNRAFAGSGPRPLDLLRSFDQRSQAAGEKFSYASAESDVLGRVVAAAAGRDLAQLTSEWIWQPLGAERDALWRVSVDGQEQAGGGFAATLRDWGRLGLLLANDGRVAGQQVLLRDYLQEATDAARQPLALRPGQATRTLGYGYQFWLSGLQTRSFVLQGVFGQAVFVQPSTGIVMVHTAVFDKASGRQDIDPVAERGALWLGVLRSLGGAVE